MTRPDFVSILESSVNKEISVFWKNVERGITGNLISVGDDYLEISNPRNPNNSNYIPFENIRSISVTSDDQ